MRESQALRGRRPPGPPIAESAPDAKPYRVVTVDSRELYSQVCAPDSGSGHLAL